MSLNPKPAAFIFDMDGTLLDTEPLYSAASQKVLDPYGVEYTPELKQRCIGGDSHNSAQIVIDHYDLPLTSAEYLAKREVYLVELFRTVPEMPGAVGFLQALKQASQALGLATSSHKHLVDIKLGNRPWAGHFQAIVSGDNPELKKGKPAPDIFLLCAARLGVDPTQCIAFEDSPNGVQAALAAGMQVVAIESPYVEKSALAGASDYISHYDELNAYVNSLIV
ncbi:MAG: HAD family hydrolase [Pseudomonadales bacterium]|jgi:pseudouridine-5'-monophosphatase